MEIVNYVCDGLEFDFGTLVLDKELQTKECKNLSSARNQPDIFCAASERRM